MTDFKDKYSVLRDFFGHQNFREGQEEIIDCLLSGRDVLGIMPTGAGKSMCYQIPALMMDGITVVISPLISLMKDQVNALIQSGVRAAYLNSSLTQSQYETAVQNAKRGMYKIIYAAPERLSAPSFLSLAQNVKISMLTVDESHCVSQWGQDFRPSYMKIPQFISKLPYRPTIGAFTATATKEVKQDIIRMLELNDPFCLTTGFDRKNLYFGVIKPSNKYEQTKAIVKENIDKCGIIYCLTRKNVEMVCEKLNYDGIKCTRYHAGLSDEERRKNQDDFIYDRCRVIAATNAFGMGIDKSNVSYVIHYNMPKNIESYYQEAGRAGRDGNDAKCILLYSGQDVITNKFLIENSNDNPELDQEQLEQIKQRDLQRLKIMTNYCHTDICLRKYILNYFGDEKLNTNKDGCDNCSNCCGEFEQVDITIESQKILSCIYRLHQRKLRFGSEVVCQILKGVESEKVKRFNLTTLSTYGIMKDCTQVKIKEIIKFLEIKGYILTGEHQTLTLSRKSSQILIEKQKITMKVSKQKSPTSKAPTVRQEISGFDKELFERLKNIRTKIAQDISMPAYIVFSDSTLRDMCIKLPKNEAELLNVSGVGKAKQERYGRMFVSEIRKYLTENGENNNFNKIPPEYFKAAEDETDSSKKLLKIVASQKENLQSKNEELTLSQFCDDILTQIGIDANKKILAHSIKKWLIDENYLSEFTIENKKQLHTTILSKEAGIIEREKISSLGNCYKSILYTKEAQDFIFENLQEIAGLIMVEKSI